MSEEHNHNFVAKYKRIDGHMVIDNPCVCTDCDQLAFVEVQGYKVIVTVVPPGAKLTYTISIVKDDKP